MMQSNKTHFPPAYLTSRCPDCEVHINESHVAGCSLGSGLFRPYIEPNKLNISAVDDGYSALREVLDSAYDQASRGKGKERHANGKPFDKQPVLEMTRMVGVGGPVFQAMKKAQEAAGMANRGEIDAAIRELLGTIVYAAAAVVYLKEQK